MILSINGAISTPSPRYVNQEIIIGIDSSKTNSAIAVADYTGEIIDYIELNGSQDGTTENDTLVLCQNHRTVLTEIFSGAKPIIVGIEDIITKRDGRQENGMTVHMSRFKITAVFMSFIFFFQDKFGITPELVNNQAWKSAVLPAEYRRRDIGKGSLAYFKSINSKYQNCSDDVTDSICILKYLCIIHKVRKLHKIKEPEIARYKSSVYLVSTSFVPKGSTVQFEYNESMSLLQNVGVISNRLGTEKGKVGCASVRTNCLSFGDIYAYCRGSFNEKEERLQLVVVNGG